MTRQILLILTLMLLPLTLFAQGTTTGSIEGVITDENGETLPGANVVAVHTPTGTTYGTSSRADGRYTLRSVRVGGPYEVQVTFIGYNAQIKEISSIELGERASLDFQMEEGALELDEISITAVADRIFNSERTGASTNISREEIDRTPTISRSLSDFTRLNPQVTSGNSFGGANDRYNNILVDGATLNDVFGLGDAIPGSSAGVSSPLSIDAIAEFNVDIAPFDVTNNGFTGGQVNAITKSGTNTYTGSVYFQTRNESFVGSYSADGETASDYPEFTERYVGLNIGGPIIKDKLFFFVNTELRRETSPLTTGILGSGQPNVIDFNESTFNTVRNVFRNQYDYDPGNYTAPINLAQDNNKILAKLDWNINQDHKLSFRYNHVDAIDEEGIGRGTSSYSFSNRQYNFDSVQNSFVSQLNSSFGNNTYNELRVVYTRIRDARNVVAEEFPEVNVRLQFDSEDDDEGSIYAGIDRFSQANSLNQDLYEITNNFTYISGNHEFTVGTSNQIFTFDNTFVQDAFGTYEFRSIEDLQAGTPYAYLYSYLLPDGQPTANFKGLQFGLYAQDEWSATDHLKLTFGVRADLPVLPDDPTYNPQVPESFTGYSTDKVSSGNLLWSPRFGFNWDASGGPRTTQVRGGVGIFSGTPPFVWISNQYSNTGRDYGRIDISGDRVPEDLRFSPDPDNQPSPLDPGSALEGVNTSEINLITDDFKYPQALKVNLAIDQEISNGFIATLEGVYSNGINDVTYENLNIEQVGTTPYGRPIYGDIYLSRFGTASGTPARVDEENFTNALLLKNTNKNYQYSVTGSLEKRFRMGLTADLSYTYNRAMTVNNGTSSRAISNWQYNENVDVNNPELGTADFERRHRILGVLSYQFSWLERLATSVSLIYDGRSGTPFSWIYNGDANGDGRFDNDLMYIPANESEVVMVGNNWNEYDAWISDTESVSDYRGDFVDRGTAREPWTNYLDLRVSQSVQTFSGQSVEFSLSMFNVLNFLNDEWGIREGVDFNNYRAVDFLQYVDQDYIIENPGMGLSSGDIGKPILDFDPSNVTDDEIFDVSDFSSRWQMQFSVRYSF